MANISFEFNEDMRELFDYPDPSVPAVVWTGDFCDMFNQRMAYHWHNEFEYCTVMQGTVGFTIDGNYIEVSRGDAVFINSNAMHSAIQIGTVPAKVFTVSFLPDILTENKYSTIYRKFFLPILQSSVKGFSINVSKKYAADILKYLIEVCDVYNKHESDYELAMVSLISRLWSLTIAYLDEYKEFISLSIVNRRDEEIAKSILNFIHNHYSEDINIDDMAKNAITSRSGCFRSFRNFMNKTPMEYLNEYRIARAMMLMAGEDKSITQIATECGFSSPSYFGKLFRKKHGMTPLDYKRQL